MPVDEPTEYATPIPLRDNVEDRMSPEMPNPYSRLEAVMAVKARLSVLASLLRGRGAPSNVPALVELLEELVEELDTALWGDLRGTEAVRHRGDIVRYLDAARAEAWELPAAPAQTGVEGRRSGPADRPGVRPPDGLPGD